MNRKKSIIRRKNETIAQLRREQEEARSVEWALRRNIADYRARHDKAVDALTDLSIGLGITENGRSHVEAMQRLAGRELRAISKMPLREGP